MVRFSPLDIYKIFSTVVFLGLGVFFIYQGLTKKGFSLWFGFGIVLLAYGLFRVWVAYKLIRKISATRKPNPLNQAEGEKD